MVLSGIQNHEGEAPMIPNGKTKGKSKNVDASLNFRHDG